MAAVSPCSGSKQAKRQTGKKAVAGNEFNLEFALESSELAQMFIARLWRFVIHLHNSQINPLHLAALVTFAKVSAQYRLLGASERLHRSGFT